MAAASQRSHIGGNPSVRRIEYAHSRFTLGGEIHVKGQDDVIIVDSADIKLGALAANGLGGKPAVARLTAQAPDVLTTGTSGTERSTIRCDISIVRAVVRRKRDGNQGIRRR